MVFVVVLFVGYFSWDILLFVGLLVFELFLVLVELLPLSILFQSLDVFVVFFGGGVVASVRYLF